MTPTSTSPIRDIARTFAIGIRRDFGAHVLEKIDELNNAEEVGSDVCHSHDFLDANVYMDDAIAQVTGHRPSYELPDCEGTGGELWMRAWRYTKLHGFSSLGSPGSLRGHPDIPPGDPPIVTLGELEMNISLPEYGQITGYPLAVDVDYWGRDPHMQLLIRDHNGDGEPNLCVRFDQSGKVVEVLLGSPDILVIPAHQDGKVKLHVGNGDTPWEIERERNPVCEAGDSLRMPSGQVATVMSLRDRYDNDIEKFRDCDRHYGILNRMDSYPVSDPRCQVYISIEQAWEINPLTAGTTDPSDFSTVHAPKKPDHEQNQG